MSLGKILKVVTLIPGLIQGVESLFGRNGGSNKKEQVVDTSLAILEFETELRDKGVVDEKMFREGLAEVNDGIHKMLKASKVIEN